MIIRANVLWMLPVTLLAIGCVQNVEVAKRKYFESGNQPQFPGAAQARKALASLVY